MLLTEWNLSVEVDDVLRGQGAEPAALRLRRPALVSLAKKALADALPHVRPRVAYHIWDVQAVHHRKIVLEQGKTLSGAFVVKHLAQARQIVAVICTIGAEIDSLSSQAMSDELPYALALDGVGAAAAEALGIATCDYFTRQVSASGWQTTLPLSPGMDGWPTDEGQCQVFQLVNGEEAGVILTESCLMIPRKSVSFILGLGPEVQKQGETCDYCALKQTCRYRRSE